MLNKIISQTPVRNTWLTQVIIIGGEFNKGAIVKDLQKKITRDDAELLPLLLIHGEGIKYGVI